MVQQAAVAPRLAYLPGAPEGPADISTETKKRIDAEVQRLVHRTARARALLAAHREALVAQATQLLERETLEGTAVSTALGRWTVPA